MRAGRLDRLITIQRKSETVSDSGDVVETWTTLIERRAAGYRPLRGEERFTGEQLIGTEQVEFRIRYSNNVAALTQRDRIVYPALADESPEDAPQIRYVYDILSINEIGRREGLLITALRRADAIVEESSAETLAAGVGSFSFVGYDANLVPTSQLTLAAGTASFALSGIDVGLEVARTLAAQGGSFAFSGMDASLFADRMLPAAGGSFAFDGDTMAPLVDYVLPMDAGSFAFSGTDATLTYVQSILAGAGSFAFSGTDASLIIQAPGDYGLSAASGSFSFSGADATLVIHAAGRQFPIDGMTVNQGTSRTWGIGSITVAE